MEEMESVSQTLQDATQVARMKINFAIPSSMFESELWFFLPTVCIYRRRPPSPIFYIALCITNQLPQTLGPYLWLNEP